LNESKGPFVLSPFVLAELDYLIAKLSGIANEVAFLDEIAREAYKLAPFLSQDIGEARAVIEEFSDLGIGLADASIVVLSRRLGTRNVLTLDERHFRVLRGSGGAPFRLLPADA
jgi:predicted nucleic acid-binding protein